MKRVLKVVAIAAAILVALVLLVVVPAFTGGAPIVDGQELPGARTVKDGFTSFFVLDAGPGAVALVDAGIDTSGAALLAELARRKLTADAVKAVFLTHGHGDHVAGLKVLPRAEIYALQEERPYLEGREGYRSPIATFGGARDSGVRLTRGLLDGEQVVLGSLSLRAFALPGHTAGSAAFLANGVLYLGDGGDASSDGALRGPRWLFSDDTARGRAALKALSARLEPESASIQFLAFAHSGPLPGFAPLKLFSERYE